MLIQHNPNEGLKLHWLTTQAAAHDVLIQHNPNEGLKLGLCSLCFLARLQVDKCSFSTTRTRD